MSPSLSSLSDEQLALLHLEGDAEAFSVLIQRYSKLLYGYAFRFTGNKEDAQDIAQEAFVRLHEHLPRLKLDQPLKPWLMRICTNLCRNLAKRKKFLPFSKLERDDGTSIVDSVVDDAPAPDESVRTRAARDAMRKAVRSLPPGYRSAIILYYWEGLSYEEIAKILSLPVNTVRTRLKRGKEKLESSLTHIL